MRKLFTADFKVNKGAIRRPMGRLAPEELTREGVVEQDGFVALRAG